MTRVINLIVCIFFILISIIIYQPAIAQDCSIHKPSPKIQKILLKTQSVKYKRKINKVIDKAKAYAEKNFQKNAVFVSDIDETLLDTSSYYDCFPKYNQKNWNIWIQHKSAIPIEPTIELLRWAKAKGFKVFLVTGRYESQKKATIRDLKKYNIPYDKIYLKPDCYKKESVVHFKSSTRKKIYDQGYKIIVNIGDQRSDLKGGFGKGFKLPNLLYKVP